MKLTIHKDTAARLPIGKIHALFNEIVVGEADPEWPGRVNLVVITDQRMRALNHKFRGINRSTDVLSFNIDPPQEPDSTLGEIYISAPRTTKQATEYGVTFGQEFLRLFCHGMLHLLGHDHVKPAQARAMESREESYLTRLSRKAGR